MTGNLPNFITNLTLGKSFNQPIKNLPFNLKIKKISDENINKKIICESIYNINHDIEKINKNQIRKSLVSNQILIGFL